MSAMGDRDHKLNFFNVGFCPQKRALDFQISHGFK